MPDALNPIVQKMIDAGESEENIATVIQHYKQAATPNPLSAPVTRGGVLHPLTSVMAPELEDARSALNAATETPHGQPIMARSRTGTLYPSETGTGAVNAAKSAARGAGGAVLDQAENVTSPVGLAAAGLSQMTGTLQKIRTGTYEAFRPSQILGDIEKARTISPGRVGARMLGRAAKAIRTAGDMAPEAAAPAAQTAPAAAPTEGTGLSSADRASLVKRYPGLDPSKVEQQMTGRLQMAPTDRPPMTVSPQSPMQAPRVQVGADALAKGTGQTPTQIRTNAGPVGAEAVGAPREGMPDQPFQRVFNTSLEQPRGSGRASYADAGNGEKTRIQTNAIARAQDYIGQMRDAMPPEQFAEWVKKFVLAGAVGGPAMMTGRLRSMPSQEP